MFGREKFEKIFEKLEDLERDIDQIRETVDKEIKIIERAGKPIVNKITEEVGGDFYNHPLRDITQFVNSYFDSVISFDKLLSSIRNILKKYDLSEGNAAEYFHYLVKSGLISKISGQEICRIIRDNEIPGEKKEDRGIFDELGMS